MNNNYTRTFAKIFAVIIFATVICFSDCVLAASKSKSKAKAKANPKQTQSQQTNSTVSTVRDLFWKKSWDKIEQTHKSNPNLTLQELSLIANAYRFQNKWQQTVEILEQNVNNFPASVKPYAEMTLILGYENLKRPRDGLVLAERLWKTAPQDLKYYVAYAQFRLHDSLSDSRNAHNALQRMLNNAGTEDKKIFTLKKLIAIANNNDKKSHALQLLELQPSNKEAANILSATQNWDNNTRVALGVYSHLSGNNETAIQVLSGASGRKAMYYHAWSLSRSKQNTDALNLWGNLAMTGNSYAASSVTRIGNLAKDPGMKEPCIQVLERIARERKGNVKARAMQALINLIGKENSKRKTNLEAQMLKLYPKSTYAFNILWQRAWNNLNSGNASEAVKLFKQCDAPGVTFYKRARILYWLAHAQKLAGQKSESEKTLALLKRKYPLTIYGLLTLNPNEIRIIDGNNPSLNLAPSELEEWGFINNAYLKLSAAKATTKQLYRALLLSRWLGRDESYSEARKLETLLTSSTTLYRTDLEALYPRPFYEQVEAASKRYGVEKNFVWAIMRQESAFKADARSWVGAAGLMQLMPATAKDESKRAGLAKYDVYNPSDNIKLGTSHLSWLGKTFARKEWVMAAYNAGSGNARKWLKTVGENVNLDRWIEAVKFDETCGYVQRVSANLEIYRMLYGDD